MTVVAVGALLVASPALSRLLVYPRTEFFTELWILGSNHMAEGYPYNVSRNQNYSIFLGVGNRLGHLAYYDIAVKFRNQTQPAPVSFGSPSDRAPSSLPSLLNITAFVADEKVWELPLTISFDYGYNETLSKVEFRSLRLNNIVLDLRGYATLWNSTNRDFYGNLFFEAWIYNATGGGFQYHERFVGLRFNMTI